MGMRVVPTIMIAACATAAPIVRRTPEPPPANEELATTEPEITQWFRSWDAIAERERLAQIAANDGGLETEYGRACGPSSPPKISVSPLVHHRVAGWNTHTGTVIYLSPGSGDALLADLRCHFVGLLLSPFGLDDSPFDLPGLHIDARGDEAGITLVLGVRDPSLTFELQRRVRDQLRGRLGDTSGPHEE
jgi:hypothetical protein